MGWLPLSCWQSSAPPAKCSPTVYGDTGRDLRVLGGNNAGENDALPHGGRQGEEATGRGRLFLAGVHLPAPELCLCLNSSSLQGACQFCADFHGHRLETLCWH